MHVSILFALHPNISCQPNVSLHTSQDSKRVDRRKAYIKALFEGTKMKNKPNESKKAIERSDEEDEEDEEA